MAGTVTVTEETLGSLIKITWAWTTDASGDADECTTGVYTGKVIALVTDPGSTAPTDNWDLVINDDQSVDVLAGAGANRDTADTEQVTDEASLGIVVRSTLDAVISNGGNAKEGTVYLYLRRA